jgi:hypothetical protein
MPGENRPLAMAIKVYKHTLIMGVLLSPTITKSRMATLELTE